MNRNLSWSRLCYRISGRFLAIQWLCLAFGCQFAVDEQRTLLGLYQTTFDEPWFDAACELEDTMLDCPADLRGEFFDASGDAEQLVTRAKDLQDNATPSRAMRWRQRPVAIRRVYG